MQHKRYIKTIELADTAVTNRYGNYVKAAELHVRRQDINRLVIEALYSTGSTATGLMLSDDDAKNLFDMLGEALGQKEAK